MAHRFAVAALTSAGVFAAIMLLFTLRNLTVSLFGFPPAWELAGQTALVPGLPVAVGLFVSLALLLPVTGGLPLRSVLVRGAGSLIPIAVLLFIGQWIVNAALLAAQSAQDAGGFTDVRPYPGNTAGIAVATAGQQALSATLTLAPLVLLAVVLQWVWLHERLQPRRTPIGV